MSMHSTRGAPRASRLWLAVVSAVLLAAPVGCDDPDEKPPGEEPSEPEPLTVALTSPTGTSHVRSTVTLQVRVEGGEADSVELLKDGAPLATLTAPYAYTWDTGSVTQGTYVLTARVTRGADVFTSAPLELVVDRTAPTVVSHLPMPGDDEWDGVISITASEPLAASSLLDASVKLLEDGTELPKKLVLSADGRTVSVVPAQALDLPADLDVVFDPTWTDLAGNPLDALGQRWGWKARTWRLLKTPARPERAVAVSPPSLAVDGDGRPLLSFVEVPTPQEAPLGGTVVTRWTGGGWERFSPTAAEVSGRGWLAVDGSGHIFLAGSVPHDGSQGPQSFYVRRWEGQAWGPVATARTLTWSSSVTQGTRLAVTTGGRPVLTFETARFADPGGTWPGVSIVENGDWKPLWNRYLGKSLALTLEAGETPWVTYVQKGPESQTYVIRWDGTAFVQVGDSLVTETTLDAQPRAAELQVDASGVPYLVWRNGTHLYLQRWNGTRWETLASREAAGSLASGERVSLVIGRDTLVYVAWAHRPAAGQAELRVEAWNGTSLEPVLTGLPAHEHSGLSLALDAHGRPMVTWLTPPAPGQSQPGIQVRVNH